MYVGFGYFLSRISTRSTAVYMYDAVQAVESLLIPDRFFKDRFLH